VRFGRKIELLDPRQKTRGANPEDGRADEEGLQCFIGGGFFKVINFGVSEESESANSEAVVGDFADACSLEGLDGQSDAS